MNENKQYLKEISLRIRKHLFENKPYSEFDLCYLCGKGLTYKTGEIALVTEDFLPACACKKCLKKMREVRKVIESNLEGVQFNTKREYLDAVGKAFDVWVGIKRKRLLKNL